MHLDDEFYAKVIRSIPIVCVDLLITDDDGSILMVHRNNPPAAGDWWFPGGRTLLGEKRDDAVTRKLHQECGLTGSVVREYGSHDLIMDRPDGSICHALTTVYHVRKCPSCLDVILDSQSSDYSWRSPDSWLETVKYDWLKWIIAHHVRVNGRTSL